MNYSNQQYSPNTQFSVFPPAIKHLLIINGLVFVGLTTPYIGQLLFEYGALWPFESSRFYPWQVVTYMFLHGGFGHIIFNLFALWMFGQAIERLWGTKQFVMYYFITGIGAALFHMFVGAGGAPTVGASGAVYGILLAFGMMFPERPIFLFLFPVPIKAKYFVALFGGLELINGITGTQTGIAHFAHLGGMIFGFALIKYWKMNDRIER